jgi:uncharacterized membrane protein YgcG
MMNNKKKPNNKKKKKGKGGNQAKDAGPNLSDMIESGVLGEGAILRNRQGQEATVVTKPWENPTKFPPPWDKERRLELVGAPGTLISVEAFDILASTTGSNSGSSSGSNSGSSGSSGSSGAGGGDAGGMLCDANG